MILCRESWYKNFQYIETASLSKEHVCILSVWLGLPNKHMGFACVYTLLTGNLNLALLCICELPTYTRVFIFCPQNTVVIEKQKYHDAAELTVVMNA